MSKSKITSNEPKMPRGELPPWILPQNTTLPLKCKKNYLLNDFWSVFGNRRLDSEFTLDIF